MRAFQSPISSFAGLVSTSPDPRLLALMCKAQNSFQTVPDEMLSKGMSARNCHAPSLDRKEGRKEGRQEEVTAIPWRTLFACSYHTILYQDQILGKQTFVFTLHH